MMPSSRVPLVASADAVTEHATAGALLFERAVLWSGFEDDALSNPDICDVLEKHADIGRTIFDPHLSLLPRKLGSIVLETRENMPLTALMADARKLSRKLPAEITANIKQAQQLGSFVTLLLSKEGNEAILRDVATICVHFGQDVQLIKGLIKPHVSIMKLHDLNVANGVVDELNNALYSERHKAGRARMSAIAFGSAVPLFSSYLPEKIKAAWNEPGGFTT